MASLSLFIPMLGISQIRPFCHSSYVLRTCRRDSLGFRFPDMRFPSPVLQAPCPGPGIGSAPFSGERCSDTKPRAPGVFAALTVLRGLSVGPAGKRSYAHAPPSPRLSLCLCLCVCLSVCLSFSLYLPPPPHVCTRPFPGFLLRSPLLAALQVPRPLTPSPRPLRPSPSWPGSPWWPRRAILKEEASGLCSRWHEFHCHRLRKSLSCTWKERAGTSLFRGAPPLGGRRALTRDGDGPHHTDQLSWFKSSSSTG